MSTLPSNPNDEPLAAGHAGWCLYRLDCERRVSEPRSCNCGARSLAESLRQALSWEWNAVSQDALVQIQEALRIALRAHDIETFVQPVTWRRLIDSAYTLKPEWIYTNQAPTIAPEKWEPLYPAHALNGGEQSC